MDKVFGHRRYRRKVRIAIEQEAEVLPHYDRVVNPYTFNKEGKMRFDPETAP